MAGHSKWANIKHRKAAQDAKRGKIFTKLIREITVAARLGGPEPNDNPRLRAVVDKALTANMTRDTIDRAIKRGAGNDDTSNMSEITYEGYGPAGVAVLVETMTDNVNRTVSDVRHAFTKHGGNLGTNGSVAYLFSKRGEILFEPGTDEEALMEAALEAGAEDVQVDDDGSITVITTPDGSFGEVVDALKAAGFAPVDAEVTMHPSTEAEVDGDTAATIMKMIDHMEDLDDVQNVYTNVRFPDDFEG
ncbi:YebC/PmpR family DNA-binding transcriptional regulator [Alcanivorax quisquiliarum]|uniref:Probable transcriptional regulatory protein MU846_10780 n=1 Tax=Alcanivorax quisquiliarum TaxID=2933565 RepID=A0ABT0E8N3_9GAMM|nr:YebC/PmpR family DNA-binding transcriptional regulator [Alcanivorax quisquiliarum]MCK0538194.1 YebC/PmpR family DNA-binding transcriptional regulator [Alcanivorax quisquiliarum]